MIYLDHNATSPLLPEVEHAIRRCRAEGAAGNPSSLHAAGRRARRALEDARETVAAVLDAHPDEVIFTSGATEANNLALFGLAALGERRGLAEARLLAQAGLRRPAGHRRDAGATADGIRILTTPVEHPSVAQPLAVLAARGWKVEHLGVSRDGLVDCGDFARRLGVRSDPLQRAADDRPGAVPGDEADAPALVSIQLANNETGVIQPIAELAAISAKAGVPFHTDAAQAVGRIPVSFRKLNVTAMSISAHKFGGPRGVGTLLVRRGTCLEPLLHGGHQERGLRPGTEPVDLIVAVAAALEACRREADERARRLAELRDRLWEGIHRRCPDAVVNGEGAPRLPNTLSVSLPGVEGDKLLIALDMAGVCCSTGSACSSGSIEPSPTLVAMGLPQELLAGAMRFSVGVANTLEEIQRAAEMIGAAVERVKGAGLGYN